MKNILQIVPTKSWGGGERYVYDLSSELKERGNKIVFAGRRSPIVEGKFSKLAPYVSLPLKFLFDIYSSIKIAFIIKRYKIDIIHVHIFKDAFMAAIAMSLLPGVSCKLIMTRHLVKRGKGGFLYNWLYKRLSYLIFVSHLTKDEFLSGDATIAWEKIVVLHNCIVVAPKAELTSSTLRDSYSIWASTLLLAYSGRLSPEKGIDTLLQSMTLIKSDVALVIAGSGEPQYVAYLKRLAVELGVESRVFFVGFEDNIFPFISQVDIAVLPSVCRESFGLVVLEYMAMGVPVITTGNGAQVEIIEDGVDGFLVEPRSETQIAALVDRLAADSATRGIVGERAIEKSKKFDYQLYVDQIEELYK